MNFPISDYQRLQEFDEFSRQFADLIGEYQLVNEPGISDYRGHRKELDNHWFTFAVDKIVQKASKNDLASQQTIS